MIAGALLLEAIIVNMKCNVRRTEEALVRIILTLRLFFFYLNGRVLFLVFKNHRQQKQHDADGVFHPLFSTGRLQ